MKMPLVKAAVIASLFVTFAALPMLSYADLQITVSPASVYNTLDLTVSQTDRLIATVTEICTTSGYTVTLETANGNKSGLFRGANPSNSDTFTYDIKYNGAVVGAVRRSSYGNGLCLSDNGSWV